MAALPAVRARKTVGQNAAFEVAAELSLHVLVLSRLACGMRAADCSAMEGASNLPTYGRRGKRLGAAVGCYVVYGLTTGAIFAKCKAWRRTFRRNEDATGYWSAIAAYVVLAGMLLTQIRGPRPRR